MKQPEQMNYNELCDAGIISYYTARNMEILREYEKRLAQGEKMIDIEEDIADRLNQSPTSVHAAIARARKKLRG